MINCEDLLELRIEASDSQDYDRLAHLRHMSTFTRSL
jgi:hypothetical protein